MKLLLIVYLSVKFLVIYLYKFRALSFIQTGGGILRFVENL